MSGDGKPPGKARPEFRLIQNGLSDPRTAALVAEREGRLRRIEEIEHILSAGRLSSLAAADPLSATGFPHFSCELEIAPIIPTLHAHPDPLGPPGVYGHFES